MNTWHLVLGAGRVPLHICTKKLSDYSAYFTSILAKVCEPFAEKRKKE